MALDTYANLKTAIANTTHRDDLVSRIDDFIDLCEADLWRKLRIREMDTSATASTSTSDRFLALPDSFLEMRKFKLTYSDVPYRLEYRSPQSLEVVTVVGRPYYYTISSQIEFDRTSDVAYTAEMQYWKSLTPLSSSNTTNSVLTRFPNLYLYGSLHHLYISTLQEDKAAIYKNYFDSLIRDVNEQEDNAAFGVLPAAVYKGSAP